MKYAMMFIALTFLAVLIFEIGAGGRGSKFGPGRRTGARLHLVQYGLIGLLNLGAPPAVTGGAPP